MRKLTPILLFAVLISCAQADEDAQPFTVAEIATLDEPWAMAFLPDGRLLVTEQRGNLRIVTREGEVSAPLAGVPEVAYGGQGGLGDVALHPDFASNRLVYLSYAEQGDDRTRGAAVVRGRLSPDESALLEVAVIWRQQPKVSGRGHYGHRLLFGPSGHLFVSSGERQKFEPAQDMQANLGKILRLNDDGSPAADNPFADAGGVTAEIWSLGHRNPLGIAFDADGQLWNIEMGPRGGDELNRVLRGENYGYPIVSEGRHYSGRNIPNHDTRPEFAPPAIAWTPVISPGDLMIYQGERFPGWRGNAFAAGLSSKSLVRIELLGDTAREVERFDMGERMRAVRQGPDGDIWMLSDPGKLLRLTSTTPQATTAAFRRPAADNLLVMTLPQGQVVIELAPQFAPQSVENIRTMTRSGYYDGLAIVRSQDNYVAQWADPNAGTDDARPVGAAKETIEAEFFRPLDGLTVTAIDSRDAYADNVGFVAGLPMAHDGDEAWLTHCYGMLGVSRGMEANSGNGSSLYVVTGHAPRHLDRNITLAGRVLSGMQWLSSLPRGTGDLGFYETPEEYVPILRVQLAADMAAPPSVSVIDTGSRSFADYVAARTHRRNEWFFEPTGRIEICNLHPEARVDMPVMN